MDREALAAWLEDKKPVKEPRLIKVRPRVRSLALAPDGRRLAVYTDERQLMVWDLARARIVWSNAPKEEFPQLLFSPDARYLLGLAAWDGLHAWDAARGRAVHPAAREPKSVWLRAFTPDSTGLWVWTDHNKSERWDLVSDTRTEGQPDPRPRDIAATLESEADKTLGRVLVFDADSRRPLRTFAVPLKQPRHSFGDFERNHVALSEKAKFLVFTTSTQVWCWRLHEPGAEPAWKISLDKDDWDNWRVSGITFAPDESFVAIWRFPIMYTMVGTSADHPVDVRFLDLRTGGELSRFKGLTNRCRWLVFSPDGKAMATNGLHSHHAVHLCDVASGALLHTFATEHSAACAAFLPDGRSLVAGCSDGSLWMWECASGGLRQKWAGHNGLVNTVLASPNGRLLASSCEDGTALVWGVAELIPPADGPWEAERLWTNLGAADAAFAYRAMAALCSRPVQAVNEIRRRLSPIPPGREARIAAWIAALDSERYREREEATHSLHHHIDLAYPLLCRAAERPASLETKRRLQRLLQHGGAAADEARARQRRAEEVLERLATEPSRQLLQELAHGDPSVPLTRDARQSLQRLRRREVSTARQAP